MQSIFSRKFISGYTLVEMMLVVTLLGVMVTSMSWYSFSQSTGRKSTGEDLQIYELRKAMSRLNEDLKTVYGIGEIGESGMIVDLPALGAVHYFVNSKHELIKSRAGREEVLGKNIQSMHLKLFSYQGKNLLEFCLESGPEKDIFAKSGVFLRMVK
ncbi:MAG: prepilin-type N-terminal cleavage/methylation domain-containing protein [Candidatus Wallbacteria bacterium]|nr:prepilin-type N-terminal cleavage/methylation domain-containing protein [Candidatus Wallbacteria bacterium]